MRIGLIDTGIRRTHQCFYGRSIEAGKDYTGQGFGTANDYNGHGTFLASLLPSGAVLIPLKCFENQNADMELLSEAIYDGVNKFGCDIIQMSWGVQNPSEELIKAVQYAAKKGVILVAASGNDGNGSLYYPAAENEVIGVGALDEKGKLAAYAERNDSTFLTAPGENLTGAGHTSDKAMVTRSGSSYAVSYVTAAIAKALEIKSELTLKDIQEGLLKTSSHTQDIYQYPVLDEERFLGYILELKKSNG